MDEAAGMRTHRIAWHACMHGMLHCRGAEDTCSACISRRHSIQGAVRPLMTPGGGGRIQRPRGQHTGPKSLQRCTAVQLRSTSACPQQGGSGRGTRTSALCRARLSLPWPWPHLGSTAADGGHILRAGGGDGGDGDCQAHARHSRLASKQGSGPRPRGTTRHTAGYMTAAKALQRSPKKADKCRGTTLLDAHTHGMRAYGGKTGHLSSFPSTSLTSAGIYTPS